MDTNGDGSHPSQITIDHLRDRRIFWTCLILFVLSAIWPFFMALDSLPLRIWDEARQAVNAYEMLHNGNWLVTHFYGEPDMWSTKPPLLIWLQVFFFRILGPGELALRLPSAIAAFLMCFFLFKYIGGRSGFPLLGLITVLLIYTSDGFIHMHVARSGDYDALLTLFMITSLIMLHRWTVHAHDRDILIAMALLAFGALTKGVQAMLFTPGILAFLLLEKKALLLLRNKYLYLGIGFFILLVGSYYVSREMIVPGYLQAVWDNELGGRYAGTLEGHDRPWDHYLRMLIDHHFTPWWMLVPLGLVTGLTSKDRWLRSWALLLTCTVTGYLLVVSSSGTKLDWYSAPAIPLLAGIAAVPLLQASQLLHRPLSGITSDPFKVILALLFVIFMAPYHRITHHIYKKKEYPWDSSFYSTSHYLHKAVRNGPLEANILCHDGYDAHLVFYLWLLKDQGRVVEKRSVDQLLPGMRVMAQGEREKDAIENGYPHEVIHGSGSMRIYEILNGGHAGKN